jgi:hypothetical protein
MMSANPSLAGRERNAGGQRQPVGQLWVTRLTDADGAKSRRRRKSIFFGLTRNIFALAKVGNFKGGPYSKVPQNRRVRRRRPLDYVEAEAHFFYSPATRRPPAPRGRSRSNPSFKFC